MIKKLFVLLMGICILLPSCKVFYSSRMLETPPDFKFNDLPKTTTTEEFRLAPNDEFKFKLFSNDGYKLIDASINSSANGAQSGGVGISYIIKNDGTSKLPLLGVVNLNGLTIKEAEDTLEKKFSEFYIKPFVLLSVSNRKVIFFSNGEGGAKLVPMSGNTISLIEAIAVAGGIPKYGRAFSIKIIRGESKNPLVYKVDLSTLEGYKTGNIVLQSNDIVYIDARERLVSNLIAEMAPYISIVTSLALAITYVTRVSRL